MDKREKGPRPPYVTYATWSRVLQDFKENKPARLDASHFRDLGLSDSAGITVRAALSFLGLVEGDDIPTPKLAELTAAGGEDRKTLVRALLEEAYAPILREIDLKHATMGQVREGFRRLGAEGNVGHKCVTFFLALAKDAGIPLSTSLSTKSRVGAPQRRQIYPEAGNRSPAITPRARPVRKQKAPALSQLLAKLPEFNPDWPKDVREEWYAHHRDLAWIEKIPNPDAEWSDEARDKWLSFWKEIDGRHHLPPASG